MLWLRDCPTCDDLPIKFTLQSSQKTCQSFSHSLLSCTFVFHLTSWTSLSILLSSNIQRCSKRWESNLIVLLLKSLAGWSNVTKCTLADNAGRFFKMWVRRSTKTVLVCWESWTVQIGSTFILLSNLRYFTKLKTRLSNPTQLCIQLLAESCHKDHQTVNLCRNCMIEKL